MERGGGPVNFAASNSFLTRLSEDIKSKFTATKISDFINVRYARKNSLSSPNWNYTDRPIAKEDFTNANFADVK